MKSRASLAHIVAKGFASSVAASLAAVSLLGIGTDAARTAHAMAQDGGGPGSTGPLLPRKMVTKPGDAKFFLPRDPSTGEPWFTGNIVLKFHDWVGARANTSPSPVPFSVGGNDLTEFAQILADEKLMVRQWINETPADLAALEMRAQLHSGRAQPDLAGMMIIEGVSEDRLVEVARSINKLPEIEFAMIERTAILHQCGPDSPDFCNVPGPSCDGQGFNCNPDPGNAMDLAEYGCQDALCCERVAGFLPFCNAEASDQGWNILCAVTANQVCDGTIYDNFNPPAFPLDFENRYDPCFVDDPMNPTGINPIFEPYVINGSCFEPWTGRGCSEPLCCFSVCQIDPGCCATEWDQVCADFATNGNIPECETTPNPGATDDFTPEGNFPIQFYLQGNPQPDPVPGEFNWIGKLTGWTGAGFDIDGFRQFQIDVAVAYQDGAPPPLDGEGTRIAIIEFAAFVNHEDFILSGPATDPTRPFDGPLLSTPRVIAEEGPTIVLTDNDNAQHGTACLGQVVAADNGLGVTGIAKNAQGYFFPIVSFEEGFRAQNAIINCFQQFRAGDIVNHSWGSPPDLPLPSQEQYYTLLALGSDLGITTFCSAGNSDCPIQPQPGEVDCNAVVVGAAYPGTRNPNAQACLAWNACLGRTIRCGFSNYSGEDGLSEVHVSGWGSYVATVGTLGQPIAVYDHDLPPGADPFEANQLRTYTQTFNGTSSASPTVAGAAALLQTFAKQVFGTPIAPAQLRGVLGTGRIQCPTAWSDEECGIPFEDCCNVLLDPDCDGVLKPIGPFPLLVEGANSILRGDFVDGNPTDIRVVTGVQPPQAPWVSFLIRAADQNYLRIETERARSGQIEEGLTYLATGPTTDLVAELLPPLQNGTTQLDNVGVSINARSTRNFTFLGAFIRNFETGRFEFIGADLLTTIGGDLNFDLPNAGDTTKYVDPVTGNIQMRIWTCGLGLSRAHEVWYDLIEIRVNNPLEPL